LLEHPVERVEGFAHPFELGGVGVGERLGHLVEVGTGDLLAQALEELFEVLARLGGDELVLLEAAHRAGEIVRQEVELHTPLVGNLPGDLLAPLVTRLLCIGFQRVDAFALGGDHLRQLFGDLVERAAEVATVADLLALEPEPLEQVAQALHVLAVRRPPAAVEHALQRLVQISVGEQIVRQLREDRVGIVDEGVLGPVPLPVLEPPGHPRPR